MGAIIVKVGTETKKIAIDLPPNYNPIRFNDAGTVRGCRLVRPGLFNATPVHTMVDGRVMALAGSAVLPIKDAEVWSPLPDTNYGNLTSLLVLYAGPTSAQAYAYIGNLPQNKNVNYYVRALALSGGITYKVYETINTWEENIITWNNKTALGDLLGTFPYGAVETWWSFPTGTTGSIVIVPSFTEVNEIGFWSMQYSDPTKHPYISP